MIILILVLENYLNETIKSVALYEEIRAEQAKVMMAGAQKGSSIY